MKIILYVVLAVVVILGLYSFGGMDVTKWCTYKYVETEYGLERKTICS